MKKLLSHIFDRIAPPPALETRQRLTPDTVFVARERAAVVEAIILSFARRAGFNALSYGVTQEANSLRWVSVEDENSLDLIAKQNPATRFITVNIFSGHGPLRSRAGYRLSWLDSLGMIFGRSFLIIRCGEPIVLSDSEPNNGKRIARRLKLDFYQNLRLVRGTPFLSRDIQARMVLGGAEYEREIAAIAPRLNISVSKAKRKAERTFLQMAANPLRPVYLSLAFLAKVIIHQLFSYVRVSGLEKLEAAARQHPVVIIPGHRSHLDYILLGSLFYEARLNTPLVAAGVNLSFWPIGFFLRSAGAYFIKRDAARDHIHSLVLKRYVTYLIKAGHLQEFFIEGGRSRSGKMRPPKLGLLKILTEAYLSGIRKDVRLVPVSITYEQVIEDKQYGTENTGARKVRENLWSLLKARNIFAKSYGEVVVSIGDALTVSQFVEGRAGTENQDRVRGRIRELAQLVTTKIQNHSSVSLTGLSCCALLMAPRYALFGEDLRRIITELNQLVDLYRAIDPEIGPSTETLKNFLSGKPETINSLDSGDVITSKPLMGKTLYVVPGRKRFTADFYRNSCIHLFVHTSCMALSELATDSANNQAELQAMQEMFSHDFQLLDPAHFNKTVEQLSAELVKRQLIVKSSSDGAMRFASRQSGIFNPSMLLSTVQAHLWVRENLVRRPAQNENVIEFDQFLNQLQEQYRAAISAAFGVSRTEAASRSTLEAVIESLSIKKQIALRSSSKGKEIVIQSLKLDEIEQLKRWSITIERFLTERAIEGCYSDSYPQAINS